MIELLMVIAIIGILASVVLMTSIGGAAQARDAKRIQELYQIAHAIEMYYSEKEEYPGNSDSGDQGCWGDWDGGSVLNGGDDPFIEPLITEGFLTAVPKEERPTGESNWEKCSFRYKRMNNPCGGCVGNYAILYAVCETDKCPIHERPSCCNDDGEGGATWDKRDIAVFFKER